MLFDERDLNVFDNNDSKVYFKEILQLYYSQNYRATVVLLYSFVVYDLFIKLQTMATEGSKDAANELAEINVMIVDDEKYSKVEKKVIGFFLKHCSLYFNKFSEDIEYLQNCRNKCAHLKVNDNSLYIPSDYHVRMLICSMYDNILSVKAPFIIDLFTIAQPDVEKYSTHTYSISYDGIDESVIIDLRNKYLDRMTYDSIKKSYKTFLKLLFISQSDDCENNISGLYVFVFGLTDQIIKRNYKMIFAEEDIKALFSRITIDIIQSSELRCNALASLMINYPIVLEMISMNAELYDFVCKSVLTNISYISYYSLFYSRTEKSIYQYFKENPELQKSSCTELLFEQLKESADFDINEYMTIMVRNIPTYYGFSSADAYMTSLINHIQDMSTDTIKTIMKIYRGNNQCVNRTRHDNDIKIINKFLDGE